MKKVLVALACAFITFSAQAQKGSWYIGGNAGFNTTSGKTDNNGTEVDNDKTTTWSFSPEVGTFLTNHLQLGVGLTFMGSKWDARTTIKKYRTTTYTGATIFSRYFFGNGNFRPFVGVNVSMLPGKEKETNATLVTETKLRTVGANVNAGFAYALSPSVTVVGSFGTFGFEATSEEVEGSKVKQKTSSFGLDAGTLGNRFNVGVYYTFHK